MSVDLFCEEAAIERKTYKTKATYRVSVLYRLRWACVARVRSRRYTELIVEDRSITIKGRVAELAGNEK